MNANSATKPGMMPIKNLAKNGPVGVLKPRCITRLARTFRSTRTRHRREQYMPLVAFCLRHFSADFIICTCEFKLRAGGFAGLTRWSAGLMDTLHEIGFMVQFAIASAERLLGSGDNKVLQLPAAQRQPTGLLPL
jgi:hypothetical protein